MLKGRILILARKDVNGLFPTAQALPAFDHHRPTNLCPKPFLWPHPLPPFFFSSVLRKRYESVPVSMMWAWSVSRSSMALHNRAFGNIVVHSENGRFVVTITAALSALPAMIWNNNSAAASGIAT